MSGSVRGVPGNWHSYRELALLTYELNSGIGGFENQGISERDIK